MKRYLKCSLISSFLMFLLINVSSAEEMTNLEFAKLLIPQLELESELPDNYKSMPADEQFEIATGLLASKGVTAFVDKSYDAAVSAGEASGVMKVLTTGGSQVKADKINRIAKKSALESIEPSKALSVEEGQKVIDTIKAVDKGYVPPVTLNYYIPSKPLVVTQLVPGPGVSQRDVDVGIKLDLIKVDPDITKPYTHKASPTI